MPLSVSELKKYYKDGFVIPDYRLSEETLEAIKTDYDKLLRVNPEFKDYCPTLLKYDRNFLKYAQDPEILNCVKQVIGPNLAVWNQSFFAKPGINGKETPWHQDGAYWPIRPLATCTVWLAVDDSTTENGCMRVVSGSHLHGPLKYRFSEPKENNVLYATVDDAEKYGKIVDIELSAGQISLHSDLLLHSSNYNNSKRRRCGLALRYNTTDVRLGNEFEHQLGGVLVSGEDKENYWGNPSRPNKDLFI